jgi:hypothetical protein
MNWYYKLEGHTPVAVDLKEEWNLWLASSNTTVMLNEIKDCMISTVFVGMDLNLGYGEPMFFETLVMGGALNGKRNRYSTWDEAIKGHLKICTQVFKLLEIDAAKKLREELIQYAADTKDNTVSNTFVQLLRTR